MRHVLLTAFEPFDGETVNPSQEAVRLLDRDPPEGVRLTTAILPVTYAAALPVLFRAIGRHRPDCVVAVGQAGGRSELSVERVAINVDDGRIADNAGIRRIDEPVIAGAPSAYFATVPIKAMAAAMRVAGVPARVSQTAGTFLCNHVFFGLCHHAASQMPRMTAGFVHVPYLPAQAANHAGAPSMSLLDIVTGLRAGIVAAASMGQDARVAEGALH